MSPVQIEQTVELPPGYEVTHVAGSRVFIRTEPTVELPSGLTGYYMTPEGACLAACVATILQRPLGSLPDIREAGELLAWGLENGLTVNFLNPATDPRPMGFSIGVSPPTQRGVIPGARHTVVLLDGCVHFDPASCFLWPNGKPPAPVKQIDHAITLTEENL